VTPTWMTLRECRRVLKKANNERKKRSVTGRKSHAQICWAWVCRNVFQVCPCGRVVRTARMYFCMVRLQTWMPSLSNSPRMRSAPHNRLSLAISWIKEIVSWEILGVREVALDLYFQKSLKPWRCQREPRLWLDNDEGLFPVLDYPGQKNQKQAVRRGRGGSFHLSPENDELLTQERVFCHQLGLAPGKVGQCQEQQRGGLQCGPGDEAVVERPKTNACQALQEGENPLHNVHSPLGKDEQVNA